jgi:hypothetical protein
MPGEPTAKDETENRNPNKQRERREQKTTNMAKDSTLCNPGK